jgi:hypothetical protein
VVDELYRTVSESDTLMRSIPALLVTAGYNNAVLREMVQPLLEKYPDLALAVLGGVRMPSRFL